MFVAAPARCVECVCGHRTPNRFANDDDIEVDDDDVLIGSRPVVAV